MGFSKSQISALPCLPRDHVLGLHRMTEREYLFLEELAAYPRREDDLLFQVAERLELPHSEQPNQALSAQLHSCIQKEWLQYVTSEEVERIRQFVKGVEFVGEATKFPRVADVDYTLIGGAIFRSVSSILARGRDLYPVMYGRVTRRTREVVFLKEVDAAKCCALVGNGEWMHGWEVKDTRRIQEWRGRWWEKWHSGVVVVLEWNEALRNTQVAGGDTQLPVEDPNRRDKDLSLSSVAITARLPGDMFAMLQALTAAHGYSDLHWLVMLAVAIDDNLNPNNPHGVVVVARRIAGLAGIPRPAPESLLAALAYCCERGLVQVITETQLKTMRQEMADVPPLRGFPLENRYTFTDAGAALFSSWNQQLLGDNFELENWEFGFVDSGYGPGVQAMVGQSATIVVYSEEKVDLSQLFVGSGGEIGQLRDWAVVHETDWENRGPWFVRWWSPLSGGYQKQVLCQDYRGPLKNRVI